MTTDFMKNPKYIGTGMPRFEDRRLLTGGGRFTDDIHCPEALHAAFLRSPYAHARILEIDLSGCAEAGAVAAFTGEDMGTAGEPYPLQAPHPSIRGRNWAPLAREKTRFYGEPVAVFVAKSRAEAEDAAEAARVEYEVLPASYHPLQALEPGAPLVQDELGDNLCARLESAIGEPDDALSKAPHVEEFELKTQRGGAGAMECRAILAQYDAQLDRLRIYSSTQAPHGARQLVAAILGRPEATVEVLAHDVGGGFGPKGRLYPEDLVIPWLAVKLERPVKWTGDRLEFIQGAIQEREGIHKVTVGFDGEGRILALRVHTIMDTGAYPVAGPINSMNVITHAIGLYKFAHYAASLDLVYTHRVPCGPVRGASRPQGTFIIERTMDRIAGVLGLDNAEVRFRNFVQPGDMPYVVGLPTWGGPMTYESGDYPELLKRTLEKVGYTSLQKRERGKGNGKLLGVGIACNIEMTGSGPFEGAKMRIEPNGTVVVATGSCPQGQGHVSTFAQVAADAMGVTPQDVKVLTGDTNHITYGVGTFGSRSTVNAANAIVLAARVLREKLFALAAAKLEAGEEDLDIADGKVFVKSAPERAIPLGEMARYSMTGAGGPPLPAGSNPGLAAEEYFRPDVPAFACGVHVALVEVDPDTGFVKVLHYTAGHDCGTVVNPLLVDGQVHGGVAHGIGDALIEDLAFDENGTPLASTLLDYLLPLSTDIPPIDTIHLESPCPTNPLGVKGAGEGGTIGSISAVVSAIEDALKPLGVRLNESHLPPSRLHALIQQAGAN